MTTKLTYLQTNGKLKNSSVYTYAFNLPAVDTCPGAGVCREYCFAASEQKHYPSAMAYRSRSLALTRDPELFRDTINSELDKLRNMHGRKGTTFAIRIHASGDFYTHSYVMLWRQVVAENRDVQFYAYTKSIALWKALQRAHKLPSNLMLIYSVGSNQDQLIDVDTDRHARIFNSEQEAIAAGYTLASEDDTAAWQSANNKIGLVIFGATARFRTLTGSSVRQPVSE